MDIKRLFVQFIKFGLLGVVNTFLSKGIYLVLVFAHVHFVVANTVGFIVTVFIAYYLQKKFVFKGERRFSQLLRTYVVYFSTFLLETGLLWVCVRGLGIDERIAFVFPMPITIPTNFLLNKFWANKEKLSDG